ncbi:hypothetical protein I4I73_01550 [Pseudonocardia sp. KRD-184]|uniref:Secreted protein n=1 Tax=Pseudonocardia oceani TaxID=2792013 RepID=A0ABS6U374_9PSEU|nr:hypothetical protein [Pseudonocardia oceani]MBW0089053.1 hypothetical protein [Pseudonocardia oceani]MBW0094686.1 hypothetical protein [Pseudonocardia oceani]MBW0107237.1 hypothetical protein [Pseudonocardia oceani]MBW0119792.1 hypothetical protein [Pseudonocardia oceani]MBW0126692.1 hypothetical protein [Pseudonocardia oceani]
MNPKSPSRLILPGILVAGGALAALLFSDGGGIERGDCVSVANQGGATARITEVDCDSGRAVVSTVDDIDNCPNGTEGYAVEGKDLCLRSSS